MKISRNFKIYCGILVTSFLFACGGGGSSGSDVSSSGTSGIAVDPYIVGAVFEEVSADGQQILQRTSSASDASGRFQFPEPVQEGSIIRLKQGSKGNHAGAPFTGMIKRKVSADDEGDLVVSPLTTLLANGMSASGVIGFLESAGLIGLTEADLTRDPMAGIDQGSASTTDSDLTCLQANMAVSAYMETLGDFDFDGTQMPVASGFDLNDMTTAVQQIVDSERFHEWAETLNSELQQGEVTMGDVIQTAARLNRTIVSEVKQQLAANNQHLPPGLVAKAAGDALIQAPYLARDIVHGRLQMPPSDPGTDPGTDPGVDGETLFNQCSGCHSADSGSSVMNLAGDGEKVAQVFGGNHMGISLTSEEKTALSAYLEDLASGTPPSNQPATGAELYATECQGCHGVLENNDIADRSAAAIQSAIDADLGGMGGIVLTAEQIQQISDAMPAGTPPATPPADRDGKTVYDENCAGCHKVYAYDLTGTIDLASLGDTAAAKVNSGHGGTVDATELNNLATWLDSWDSAPVPTTARSGQEVYDNDCAGCHAVNSYDDQGSAPDIAGNGSGTLTKLASGHKSITLPSDEVANVADWLDTFAPGDPYARACDSCHGQPPEGSDFPDTAGAHAVHNALPGVNGDCNVCHSGSAHNDWVDLGFPATWDSKNAVATDNMDGTCDNISCHGGITTPEWTTGSINVDTQCTSCHANTSEEYNGYYSKMHKKHVIDKNIDCMTCHDTDKLRTSHFSDLASKSFEQTAASTLKSLFSYSNRTCFNTGGCHGQEEWKD